MQIELTKPLNNAQIGKTVNLYKSNYIVVALILFKE